MSFLSPLEDGDRLPVEEGQTGSDSSDTGQKQASYPPIRIREFSVTAIADYRVANQWPPAGSAVGTPPDILPGAESQEVRIDAAVGKMKDEVLSLEQF